MIDPREAAILGESGRRGGRRRPESHNCSFAFPNAGALHVFARFMVSA